MVEADTLLSWPSLSSLDLGHNYIGFVSESVLANSTGLTNLRMRNNQMSHRPSSLLASLPLMELDLASSSLSSIPASLFDRHINLERLDLSGSHLVASGLPTSLTSDLHNLLSLSLCFNKLTNLPTELTGPL